jgi:hypothetical protein
MTRTLTALIVAGALALGTSVSADTSDPTRGFSGTNLDNKSIYSGGVRSYPAAPTRTYNVWSHDGIPFANANTGAVTGAGLQGTFIPSLTAAELLAAQSANRDWVVRQNRAYVEQGGWDSPVLPVRIHSGRGHPGLGKVFGEGPQMGSNGGE